MTDRIIFVTPKACTEGEGTVLRGTTGGFTKAISSAEVTVLVAGCGVEEGLFGRWAVSDYAVSFAELFKSAELFKAFLGGWVNRDHNRNDLS
jgi:hypothetical protein